MMIDNDSIRTIAFTAPLTCAVVCLLLSTLDAIRPIGGRTDRKMHLFMIAFYALSAVIWCGLALDMRWALFLVPLIPICHIAFYANARRTALLVVVIAEVVMLPLPVYASLLEIGVIPSLAADMFLCRNLLSKNDRTALLEAMKNEITPAEDDSNAHRLSRRRVEQYLDTRKPYLNHTFRITDMAEALYTNRAYISAFINKEYGVNFSRLVNSYRLREVERLREEATLKKHHVSSLQIILNAGFGNYRSYLRARDAAANPNSETDTEQ